MKDTKTQLVGNFFTVNPFHQGIIQLVKQPDNPYDENAIAVFQSGKQIGYLPKEISARMASLLEWNEGAWIENDGTIYIHWT